MENETIANSQIVQDQVQIVIPSISEEGKYRDQIEIMSENQIGNISQTIQISEISTKEDSKDPWASNDHNYSNNNQNISSLQGEPGKVGLTNIGNTCFFNSGIQCISHAMDLVKYFKSKQWAKDLNTTNPRGLKGELATAFSMLIQKLWSDDLTSFLPTDFKEVMGKYAPQFSGTDQEDAHEFITFLLDGLNEDLNRSQSTPQPNEESIIGNGTDDLIISTKSLNYYRSKTNSIITDLFQGLLRSELRCPKCKKTTTVFDPFLSLSLPLIPPAIQADLQRQQIKELKITYVPRDFYTKYKVFTLEINGTESTFEICEMIRQKTRTSYNIMIGRIDNITHDIAWGLVNEDMKKKKPKKQKKMQNKPPPKTTNKKSKGLFTFDVEKDDSDDNFDDDSGEYHAFEYEIIDFPVFWIPCYLTKQFSPTSSEQIVGGPFLLSSIEEQPDEFELSTVCEKDIFFPKWEGDTSDVNITSVCNNGLKVQVSRIEEVLYDEKFPCFANNFVISRLSDEAFDKLKIENILIGNELISMKSQFANESIKDITLQDCLEYFSMRETLDHKNMWFCPHCKQSVCADKKLDIWTAPKYLIIHLKRFVVLETPFGRTSYKISKKVSYPFTFDYHKFIIGGDDNTNYQLIGVIEHFGSLECGHYTAFALVDENFNKNSNEKALKWYNFNDSKVTPISREDIISSDAYILVYEEIVD